MEGMTMTKDDRDFSEQTDVSFLDMFMSLSTALDLVNPRLGDHHKVTCYVASSIGRTIGLDADDYDHLFSASLVHDIGATSLADRMKLMEFEEQSPHDHAKMGHVLLDSIDALAPQAPLVRDHHVKWHNGDGEEHEGNPVSVLSHIIHLADRIAILLNRDLPLLSQAAPIRDKIGKNVGKMFHPLAAEAFADLSHDHAFWLQMDGAFLEQSVASMSHLEDVSMNVVDLTQLSRVYAFIIDSRSRFTASHSGGVATVAETLALAMDLGVETAQKVKIAGYLHDIGKISVPNEYLEKDGPLTEEERLVMKGHSFYTQKILGQVKGIEKIAEWASQHHEFLDGSGYPFGATAEELDREARILTVADIFTALTEDRPYRDGMGLTKALGILEELADDGKIDGTAFAALVENATAIDNVRAHAQDIENDKLAKFWEKVEDSLRASRTMN
jgi:putative nucleotidyltransferase with HDIG domain